MKNNFETLLEKMDQIDPPEALRAGILARINRENKNRVRTRLAFFGTLAAVSFAIMILSFQYTAQGFYKSGFYQYFSLIFSDSGVILASWKEFAISLAEIIPIAEITFFLGTILVFLIFIRLALKNIIINYKLNFK